MRRLLVLTAAACLSASAALIGGCALTPDPALGTLIGLSTGSSALSTPLPTSPDPRYRYLRVQVQGYPPAMLALAFLEPEPSGTVEVWVSAQREVLKIQNGRIVGSVGLPNDWSATRFTPPPPEWRQIIGAALQEESPLAYRFVRIHDESQGYRTEFEESVELVRWAQPLPPDLVANIPPSLPLAVAQGYTWHKENYSAQRAPARQASWFAWGTHRGAPGVVFSYQCLGEGVCLTAQAWPPEAAAQ